MRVTTIVGTRPQLLKSVMVSRALAAAGIKETLVHTGQHYSPELSELFMEEFSIRPHYNLNIPPSTSNQQTAAILRDLEPILAHEKPDIVLVYGDCSSTLGAALCASRLHIPIAHIEAGPRQHSLTIPEEINRKLTDHLSTFLFAPTGHCLKNLVDEGLDDHAVRLHNAGDVLLDLFTRFQPAIPEDPGAYGHEILVTLHRPLNTDNRQRLIDIMTALEVIAKNNILFFPIHPRTRQAIEASRLAPFLNNGSIHFHAPLSYIQTLAFLKGTKLVITDSGGLQKEAYFAGKPCLVLDSPSPWPEILATGWQRLTTPDTLVQDALSPWQPPTAHNPQLFGDGHAATRIAEILANFTGGAECRQP